MLVLKFGGSSVGSPEAIEKVIEILKSPERRGKVAMIVVSAFSGVTDKLIAMSRQAAAGDTLYLETAAALKKRHVDTAAYFLAGKELETAAENIEMSFSQLLRVLDGISVLREFSPRSCDLVMSFEERFSASLIAPILCARGLAAT